MLRSAKALRTLIFAGVFCIQCSDKKPQYKVPLIKKTKKQSKVVKKTTITIPTLKPKIKVAPLECKGPGLCAEDIKRVIKRYSYGLVGVSRARKKSIYNIFPRRLLLESKRFNLDPIAMLSIAWAESNFNPRTTGRAYSKWNRSVGIWQLIWRDSPVVKARKALDREAKKLAAGNKNAKWQDIIKYRFKGSYKLGREFSKRELKNDVMGTWIAAYEILSHIKQCKKRHPYAHYRVKRSRRWFVCNFMPDWYRRNPKVRGDRLSRYVTFNVGPSRWGRAGCRYAYKLFTRYEKILATLRNKAK